ncbi:hypothetical protein Tco_0524687 [Tanacetum coccineum]
MSTPVSTSSTDSQMHNNIMAAGSKDRPPMLGPGRYSQWRSRRTKTLSVLKRKQFLSWLLTGRTLNVQGCKNPSDSGNLGSLLLEK